MAISVDGTTNMTDVSMCDSITGWAGGMSQFALDTGVKVQGTGSLSGWINATTSATEYYAITSVDMSGGDHIYVWMFCSGVVDTQANGGYRIVLFSGADYVSNFATFYVGGNDTHGTGWQLMCCDASASPDLETGTFDNTDVIAVGVAFKTLTAAISKGKEFINNCYWDAVRYGTGLIVTSASTDDIDYEDIYGVDNNSTYKYGVIQKAYGAYVQTGEIIFGGTSTETVDVLIENEVLLFPSNEYTASGFYSVLPLGNATNPTYITIAGCYLKSAGLEKFIFDASGANINTLSIDGSTFDNAGKCTFTSGQSVTNTTFNACNIVTPSGATFTGNKITNPTASGIDTASMLYPWDTDNTQDLQFILSSGAVGHGILIDTTGTYTFTGHTFDGFAETDGSTGSECVFNDSGGSVTINIVGGDTPTIHNGTSASTTVNNSVYLTVNVKDKDNVAISGVQTAIFGSGGASLMNMDTTASGIAQTTYNFASDKDIYYRVRKSSAGGATRYVPVKGVGTIDSNGFTVTVVMYEDINIQ